MEVSERRAAQRTIAWFIQGDESYGVARAVLSLTASVRNLGWKVPIIALHRGALARQCEDRGFELRSLDCRSAPVPHGHFFRKAVRFLQLLDFQRQIGKRLADELQKVSADAVHVLLDQLIGTAGIAASRVGIPCFWEMINAINQDYPFDIKQRVYQWHLNRYRIIPLANSHYTARTLGNHPVEATVMHLGADPARFDPTRVKVVTRQDLGIPEKAIVLGILARVVELKGQDRVLQAMLAIGAHDPPLHLFLVGGPTDGAFVRYLRSIAADAGAENRVHLIGHVADPERYYEVVDIALSSRIEAEGFGLSVVEAMMMRRPVLVHAQGGPAETVVDGVTGWHVHDPSVHSFTEGIRRALRDRPTWPEMGQAARRHALEHFTTDKQAQRYVSIVEPHLTWDCT